MGARASLGAEVVAGVLNTSSYRRRVLNTSSFRRRVLNTSSYRRRRAPGRAAAAAVPRPTRLSAAGAGLRGRRVCVWVRGW